MRPAIVLVMAAAPMVTAAVGQQAATTPPSTIAAAPASAPAPAAQPRLVTIDVVASDSRGRAVEDLKAADFELREEGTLLPLESVRLVRAARPDQAAQVIA